MEGADGSAVGLHIDTVLQGVWSSHFAEGVFSSHCCRLWTIRIAREVTSNLSSALGGNCSGEVAEDR